jgi:hypothetical protein
VSVHLFVCTEQLGSKQTDVRENWYLSIFQKIVKKIQVSLQSDKNKGYFTRRQVYIFDHYKHTLRICNIYCFSTATMAARTCLNVTLYISASHVQCSWISLFNI